MSLLLFMFGSVNKAEQHCRCGCLMSPKPQAAQQGLSPCAGTTHPPRHPHQHHPLQLLCWLQMTHSQHPHQGDMQGQVRGLNRGPLPGGTHPLPYMRINAIKTRCVFVCRRLSCSWKQCPGWYHHLLMEPSQAARPAQNYTCNQHQHKGTWPRHCCNAPLLRTFRIPVTACLC